MFSLNACYFSVKHCLMRLSEDTQCLSTGVGSLGPFVQPLWSEFEKHPALESPSCSVTSNGTFTGASPLDCKSKLLSHTIVFWAFCKALYYFGWEITMEGYVQGPLGMPGPCRTGLCFVLHGSRGSPHSRSPEEWAACFDISFQFTAAGEQWFRKGLDYNIGERLHLVPFCVLAQSCAAIVNFERVFASTCTHRLSVYLVIPSKLLIPKLETCWFLTYWNLLISVWTD